MNYPVTNDTLVNALTNPQYRRQKIIDDISDKTFCNIWIEDKGIYTNIDKFLAASDNKHIIIHQVEEDWYSHHDFYSIRSKIKNNPSWTDQSFIITNSKLDKEETKKMGISAVCRPGLFDLITYQPYDTTIINFNQITGHTGLCLQRITPDRYRLWQTLANNQDNIVVAKIGNSWDSAINRSNTDVVKIFGRQIDAPYQPIDSDLWWAQHIAFGTVLETYYRSTNTKQPTFAPTLSEKTYRNMHLMRPAVICGGQHTREYLQSLGFDTWDWFVDWSFDSEPNDRIRFDKFLAEVKRLLNTPLDELIRLIDQNQDRLLYNRDRLFWLINNYDTIDI